MTILRKLKTALNSVQQRNHLIQMIRTNTVSRPSVQVHGMAFNSRPARPVILWGFSKHDFAIFFDYFVNVGFNPLALVAPTESDIGPLPMLVPEQLAADDLRHIPIILAPGLGYAGFEACRKQLTALNAIDGRVIVHSACALNDLHYDLTGRIHTVGFPGMGNVLLQSIIYRLMEKMYNPHPGIMPTPQLGILVTDHQKIVADYIIANLPFPKDVSYEYNPDTTQLVSIRFNCSDGRYLHLYGIENPHWHTGRMLTTHTAPTAHFADQWLKRGGKLIIGMRNPFDTIVSCAAKAFRPPERLLADLTWYRRMVRTLTAFLQQVHELPADKLIVGYEDILASPQTYILRIAHYLNVQTGIEHAASIWDELGLKPLAGHGVASKASTHFFRPGAGKWREYLDTRHAHIALEEGLVTQVENFGYEFTLDQFPLPSPARVSMPEIASHEITSLQVSDDFSHFLFDAPPFFSSDRTILGKLPRSGLKFVTNDASFSDALHELDDGDLSVYSASGKPLQ